MKLLTDLNEGTKSPKQYKKSVKHNGETFDLAMVTKDNVYYVNFEEGDPNGATIMYKSDGKTVVSDNYLAADDFLHNLEVGAYKWISDATKYELENMD